MTDLPDHPVVARLLCGGEAPADDRCACGNMATLWSDETGACCLDCALELWESMDPQHRIELLGFEEL